MTITEGPLIKVGNLELIVEDRVILGPVERIILNIENVVITKDRKIIGLVEDVFGPVERPRYSILNDLYLTELISSGSLKLGDPVFCLASGMKALTEDQIEEMKARKGCDASNKFDEEPISTHDKDDIYYSDDDQENYTGKNQMLGKRNRQMDEEDWKSNRVSKESINSLKEKYQQPAPQQPATMAQEFHHGQFGTPVPLQQYHMPQMPQPGYHFVPQGGAPEYYQGMYAPMMHPMAPPEHQIAYHQYLAQINMMYGYPQGTHTNYIPGLGQPQQGNPSYQGELPPHEEPK